MLTFVLLLGATAGLSDVPAPIFTGTTGKDLNAFGQCFVAAQQAEKRDWWFVPDESGGKFSNDGARGVANPYSLLFRDSANARQVRIYMGGTESEQRALLTAVKSCS